MPYRKEQFVNREIYHIVLKGIDENVIFKDINDHYRGIFSIYEFNNAKHVTIRECREARAKIKEQIKKITPEFQKIAEESINRGPTSVDTRDKIVEVLAFCVIPNHLHLLLRQLKEGGINKFMVKVGTGYGGYFNRKYSHQGHVFQKQFTAVHIKNEEQLKIVFVYIHTNSISLIEPGWKDYNPPTTSSHSLREWAPKGIKNSKEVIKFLEDFKWSSYPDYIGKKNFPSVTDRYFISKVMGEGEGCKEFVESWVKYKGEIKEFANLALE